MAVGGLLGAACWVLVVLGQVQARAQQGEGQQAGEEWWLGVVEEQALGFNPSAFV